MALGPLAGGWVYDEFGSYVWLFIGSCGILLISLIRNDVYMVPHVLSGVV
jgi:hypothetical protein